MPPILIKVLRRPQGNLDGFIDFKLIIVHEHFLSLKIIDRVVKFMHQNVSMIDIYNYIISRYERTGI